MDFIRSSTAFLATLTNLKKCGLGSTVHKDVMSKEDQIQLYSGRHPAFDINTPSGLVQKVWFDVQYYFIRRGQENQRSMLPSHFTIKRDPSGAEYVWQEVDEMDKNHRSYDSEARQSRMYAQPGRHRFDFEI